MSVFDLDGSYLHPSVIIEQVKSRCCSSFLDRSKSINQVTYELTGFSSFAEYFCFYHRKNMERFENA